MIRNQAGTSMVRQLIAIVILLAIAYVAAVTIPVVLSTFRFAQAMDTEVLHGRMNEPASLVHRRLVATAKTLDLDIPAKQIVVTKNGPRYEISADYVVPIELVGGIKLDWHFQPHKVGVRRSTALLPH